MYIERMDKNGKITHAFTERGCGVNIHFSEISEEKYKEYSELSYGELSRLIEPTLNDSIIYGYGYYGHVLREQDGLYFLGIKIGNSCE